MTKKKSNRQLKKATFNIRYVNLPPNVTEDEYMQAIKRDLLKVHSKRCVNYLLKNRKIRVIESRPSIDFKTGSSYNNYCAWYEDPTRYY